MGLFGKLKDILFDEETIEIPIITKENEEELEKETKNKRKNKAKDEDEVIVHKIETPKKDGNEDDLFDMPKLKEEIKEEPKKNTFTFPVFEDEEKETTSKRRSDRTKESSYTERKSTKRASGYTNAYDYSYGKYKGDYKSSRLANQELLTKSLEIKEEHKNFTPSPIISPVWGVLNENYKKEDIVTKKDEPSKRPSTNIDLDSVRKKAYGTLEDEIELSLGAQEETYIPKENHDVLEEDGISINDLLIDGGEDVITGETVKEEPVVEETNEIFDILDNSIDDVQEEIDIDEDIIPASSELGDEDLEPKDIKVEAEDIEKSTIDLENKKEETKETIKKDTTESDAEEDDLFDLIDSIYERKDEE